MTDGPPEELAETPEQPDPHDPEEYEPDESGAVSPDTGTAYEGEGEPASTPHDVETGEAP